MTITTTLLLLTTTQALLQGATAAGDSVYVPGDWPTWDNSYPFIRLRPTREHRESRGNGGINFDVISVIRVTARVSTPASAGDQGENAEMALWALKRQIEVAVINAPSLKALVSEFPTIDSMVEVSAEGKEHYAELIMDIGMEFYQGAEAFCQPVTVPLTNLTVAQTGAAKGPGLDIDFTQQE